METIQDLEKVIDRLITAATERLKALQQIKLIFNCEALKSNNEGINITKSEQSIPFKKDQEYPYRKKTIEKIDYLIMKEGRALKSPEILKLIAEAEGQKIAKKLRTSIYAHLATLVQKGKATKCIFNHDKRLSFYLKPEWIDNTGEYRTIQPEFYPSPEALAGIEEDRLKPENIDWTPSINTTTINH